MIRIRRLRSKRRVWQDRGVSMKDRKAIATYYDQDPQREVTRLDRHPVEFEITMRFLLEHLPAEGHVLEVGCAAGRYTLELAKLGYRVTAVDLSPTLIELLRDELVDRPSASLIETFVGDARDLGFLPETTFDAALLMGPLYHLVDRGDRLAAIRQTVNRVRPGAPFFSAHISRVGMLGSVAMYQPSWIEDSEAVESVLGDGHETSMLASDGVFRGYYAMPEEINRLHESAGLNTVAIASQDPAAGFVDGALGDMTKTQRIKWIDLFYRVCTEPSYVSNSAHILYVGRKA